MACESFPEPALLRQTVHTLLVVLDCAPRTISQLQPTLSAAFLKQHLQALPQLQIQLNLAASTPLEGFPSSFPSCTVF